ncbi:MAG: hypothetical protein H6855_05765 [Rhodospirillales bacterium]|nr:hypothetical protein [Rhodospirillales bacterium]MCB9965569.1 hypothetical protein [Rhodospirillales bacterium]MCB9979810.1 hypothetical protein [Rhodospirillales bacterium]
MKLSGYGVTPMKYHHKPLLLGLVFTVTLMTLSLLTIPKPAYAMCCSCVCNKCVEPAHDRTRTHVSDTIANHQTWMLDSLWYENVLPAMMKMANQLSAVAMQQVQIIGTFMDAEMQMQTQQLLQKLQAEAHKDYQPSEELCSIGTGVRSLASSERMGELTSLVMSKRTIDRQMRNQNTLAADPAKDAVARINQFANRYCNKKDNNEGFGKLCDGATKPEFHNKDVDFTRTIDVPLTLDVNFATGNTGAGAKATDDEQDVLAMATNLFANKIMTGNLNIDGQRAPDRERFLDYRAVMAKRSVAQNTFNTLIGMKSAGSGIGTTELNAILEELGVPAAQVTQILGNNPSYYAQMELLTKKIFQNPSFYINLYDKPANVNRKAVALQALQLMLLNDTFNSQMRTELIMALALESELMKAQEGIQGRLNDQN